MHRVVLGAHTPPQVPFVHRKGHAVSFTHLPVASQCCGVRSLHWRASGVHELAHAPALQTLAHGVPLTHCPSLPQLCGVWPLHLLSPGVHAPPHCLFVQTYGHFCGEPHWPLIPQVSTALAMLDEHCVAFGVHAPVHDPAWQRTSQGASLIQFPDVSQRCGIFSLHWRLPAAHVPPPSA
jgi:hypothetical protein